MRVIWKFPLSITGGEQVVSMPLGENIIHHAAGEGNTLNLWAEVDDKQAQTLERSFTIFGTGHEISHASSWHVGTVIKDGYVWHVYENMWAGLS